MELRKPTIADSEIIAALLLQVGYVSDAATISNQIATLNRDLSHGIAVCEFESKVVGVVAIQALPLLGAARKLGFISYLVVDEPYRKYAIANKLEAFALQFAGAHGCDHIQFRCNTRRLETRRFYERLNYRPSDKWLEKKIKDNKI